MWDKEQEKYYISAVDIVGILSKRKYYVNVKIKQEENEVSEKIGQLKLKSQDGKYHLTDVCHIEEIKYIKNGLE